MKKQIKSYRKLDKMVGKAFALKETPEEARRLILKKLGYEKNFKEAVELITAKEATQYEHHHILANINPNLMPLLICLACVRPEVSIDLYIITDEGRIPYFKFFNLNRYLHIRSVSAKTLHKSREQNFHGSFKHALYSITISKPYSRRTFRLTPDTRTEINDLTELPSTLGTFDFYPKTHKFGCGGGRCHIGTYR